MISYRKIPVVARRELCTEIKVNVVEGVCPPCSKWAAAADKLCQMPPDHPAWGRLLADLSSGPQPQTTGEYRP